MDRPSRTGKGTGLGPRRAGLRLRHDGDHLLGELVDECLVELARLARGGHGHDETSAAGHVAVAVVGYVHLVRVRGRVDVVEADRLLPQPWTLLAVDADVGAKYGAAQPLRGACIVAED